MPRGDDGLVAAARLGLEVLNRQQCLELLATVPVGRLGVSIKALPAILPVNFVLVDAQILFRTIPGTKLDAAAAGAVVAFEADGFDPDGGSGWSVLVQGVCSEVTDLDSLAQLAGVRLEPWAFGPGVADRLVRVETSFISGRRFHRAG
jgi:hypothetical protein